MNLYLRLIGLIARLLVAKIKRMVMKSPLPDPLSEFRMSLHVWPNDLDLNMHMNNGRYLTIMDLGRLHMMGRLGMLTGIVTHGWYPVVGSAAILFKRSMNPFQGYDLITRMVGWDEKWFYVEQRFERNGVVNTVGIVKGLFKKGRQLVPPQDLVNSIAPGRTSPPLPHWVFTMKDTEDSLYLSTSLSSLTAKKRSEE